MITIRFCTRWPYNPASLIIARLGGSKQWSHCFTIINGLAYEATMMHGCRVVPVDVAMAGVASYQDMDVPVLSMANAEAFGHDQKGKGYDYFGALGIAFMMSEDWGDWSKWWCSELVFMQVCMGGTYMLDQSVQKRVTVQDLYDCNYKKSEIVTLK
jgi:hypothetical protein